MADAPIDAGIKESVSNANMKTVAEAAAHSMATIFEAQALQFQNLVASSNRLNGMLDAAAGDQVRRVSSLDPAESVAIGETMRADLGAQIAALAASVAAMQAAIKGAQTIPPVTGT